MINYIVKKRNECLLQHSFLGTKISYLSANKAFTKYQTLGISIFKTINHPIFSYEMVTIISADIQSDTRNGSKDEA